jgi:hypothetical protein
MYLFHGGYCSIENTMFITPLASLSACILNCYDVSSCSLVNCTFSGLFNQSTSGIVCKLNGNYNYQLIVENCSFLDILGMFYFCVFLSFYYYLLTLLLLLFIIIYYFIFLPFCLSYHQFRRSFPTPWWPSLHHLSI